MMARAYVNTQCQVGQIGACGEDAVHLVAVMAVAENGWDNAAREGGVIPLCHYHASTAVTEWSR